MIWLHKEEYEHLAPSSPSTVRLSHCGPNDLSITRKEDGTILAYCFRCGGVGYSTPSNPYVAYRSRTHVHVPSNGVREISLPNPITFKVSEWSKEGKLWVLSSLKLTEVLHNRFGWTTHTGCGRVLIPIRVKSKLVGYQTRKVLEHDPLPKYVTTKLPGVQLYYSLEGTHPTTLVLVEDVLSAIVLNRYGYSTIALLGTSLHTECFNIASRYKKVYVWLDYDNRTVQKKQRAMVDKLSLVTDSKLVYSTKDPKYATEKEVKELLNNE